MAFSGTVWMQPKLNSPKATAGLSEEILPALGTAWGTLVALSMLRVCGL